MNWTGSSKNNSGNCCEKERVESIQTHCSNNNNQGIRNFLRSLSPGTRVTLQYDCQSPSQGIFQGFQDGDVLLSDFDGFNGLVRIALNKVNAVSVWND